MVVAVGRQVNVASGRPILSSQRGRQQFLCRGLVERASVTGRVTQEQRELAAVTDEQRSSDAALIEGVELTLRELSKVFEKHGITVIRPEIGDAFDPQRHEAMFEAPLPNTRAGEIIQAALAIVVVVERTRFAVSDGSRAIQSMILAAWSEGIGSNWVGFVGMPGVKTLLGIPDDLDVLAILPFGYPARAVGQGKKRRKPLSAVAARERFGQPF